MPKFFGKKIDGKFAFDRGEQRRYVAYLHNIKDASPMFLSVGHKTRFTIRSEQQNAYYWSVVVDLLAVHTGYTPDEMHTALKMKFLPIKRPNLPDTCGSTASLTKDGMCEYIDNIQKWALLSAST